MSGHVAEAGWDPSAARGRDVDHFSPFRFAARKSHMDKDLAVTMGHTARQARQARQLTQEQVAERLGVSSEFYSRIERGLAHPSLDTLLGMADVLGVNIDTLLGLDAAYPAARKSFPLTSAEDPPVVRRLAAELQAARPSTVRLVRAILGELEEIDAERERARRARDD
jgi:transcriptional regulator with XRE-family HTH domain